AHDYDLCLRVAERTTNLFHIPKVLYHQRKVLSAPEAGLRVRADAAAAAHRALQDALARRGPAAGGTAGNLLVCHRVRYAIKDNPAVALIIPTGGNVALLEQCLGSVIEKSTYRNFEVVLVDNSRAGDVQTFFAALSRRWPRATCIDWRRQPFNYSV